MGWPHEHSFVRSANYIIAALTEGCSIRAVERLTGVHCDTIMRLAARVDLGAIKYHDRTVKVARIELDEAWSYVMVNNASHQELKFVSL
jgi:hypothetical protein